MTKFQQARKVLREEYHHDWYPKAKLGGPHARGTIRIVQGRLVIRVYPPKASPRHISMYVRQLKDIVAKLGLRGVTKEVHGKIGIYSAWYAEFWEERIKERSEKRKWLKAVKEGA